MMLKFSIPRGVIYHKLSDDFINIFKICFSNLKDNEVIGKFKADFLRYNNSKYINIFAYARTGVYYSLKSQNFSKGSEVIMPPITIKAMVDAVVDLGLQPVFVDIDLDTYCFDINELKKNITPNTKAILVTYLFGTVPNVEEIINTTKENNLFVIEDFSQCLNGEYVGVKVGNFGNVGVYSSSTTKTLDTYGGGVCVTSDSKLHKQLQKYENNLKPAKRIRLLKNIFTDFIRNFATNYLVFTLFTLPSIKLFEKFSNQSAMQYVGKREFSKVESLPDFWFEKYTSFQAKFGSKQIKTVLNNDIRRISNVDYLLSNNKGKSYKFAKGAISTNNVYWQLILIYSEVSSVRKNFLKSKIDTSTTSLPLLPDLDYVDNFDTPNAKKLKENGLFIPSYPKLNNEQLIRIKNTITLMDTC
jgi:perosamine synthetase